MRVTCEISQPTANFTTNLAASGITRTENKRQTKLARSLQSSGCGPDNRVRTDQKKDFGNVLDPQPSPHRCHGVRRCLHHCAVVRLGRHFAADRLNPPPPEDSEMHQRFLINRRDAKFMGVAAGLADYTGIDPTLIRLGFVALTLMTGPVMIFFYLLTGLLAPNQ
jgi:phage shock protein C